MSVEKYFRSSFSTNVQIVHKLLTKSRLPTNMCMGFHVKIVCVRGKKVHLLTQRQHPVQIHILVISYYSPPKYSAELMAAATISEETLCMF